ncbi:DUF2956 domain-containing protein [Vibrio mediterranei]|uniref:DUF2956 domain-containing protein n=1 Tax=Vibrio mediterranei TaxID=689 RepID=UPI00148DAD60|nr:DUF2956 domain-containing protein [Vibrio mediterranei]NOI25945.1 DUF2956 domain-containing protein [Vibrio mediterranei]
MNKKTNSTPSPETVEEAMSIAKATQRPGQKKAETQLIAQGIEKGIALYKKQQKAKSRAADKAKKQEAKLKARLKQDEPAISVETEVVTKVSPVPWVLLIVSWIGFLSFYLLT